MHQLCVPISPSGPFGVHSRAGWLPVVTQRPMGRFFGADSGAVDAYIGHSGPLGTDPGSGSVLLATLDRLGRRFLVRFAPSACSWQCHSRLPTNTTSRIFLSPARLRKLREGGLHLWRPPSLEVGFSGGTRTHRGSVGRFPRVFRGRGEGGGALGEAPVILLILLA